jgi:hypothetical protein
LCEIVWFWISLVQMELDHAQREQLLDWLVRDAAPAPRNYFLTRLGRHG